MKDRKTPFRPLRVSEAVLAPFEERKKREAIPGPFNTYFEIEVSRLNREQPQLAALRKEISEVKGLMLLLLGKEAPVDVKAFRPPDEKHGQRKTG